MAVEKRSLKRLVGKRLDPEFMAGEYALDISAAVYLRMKELGLKRKDLAERMGVSPSRVTQILNADHDIGLLTIAMLEEALDLDLSYSFSHPISLLQDAISEDVA